MAQTDFAGLLKQAMGLDAASVGNSTIERAVRLRMNFHGLEQIEAYGRQLEQSADELQHLIEAVAVPETWFFRDRQAFSVLAGHVTEEWRASRHRPTLQLLSIPCSTGEEPYSMVMALLDAGLSPQEFQVDAVDISTTVLARATRGAYGSNSFRGEDMAFRTRYFTPTPNGYDLAAEVRNLVTFQQRNLLSHDCRLSAKLYDVIFCRNLLIYFDRPTQDLAMEALGRLLSPSGFLFVGPAEAFLAGLSGFTSLNQPMSFAFRKAATRPAKAAPAVRLAAVKPLPRPPANPAQPLRPAKLVLAPLRTPDPAPSDNLQKAGQLADAGCLREAAECCEIHLKQCGPGSEAYYLLGLVRDAWGDHANAAEYYRKALYLEPDHLQALIHLALLTETKGDAAAAGRFRERVRRIEERRKGANS